MEDFWNKITTTENEEKIEDEKSFGIDIDVKEKQQEIENAIEEVLSSKQVRKFSKMSLSVHEESICLFY